MQLMKYVSGSEITVNFGDEKTGRLEQTIRFSPGAEVPDEYVERLLTKHPGKFAKVVPEQTVEQKVAEKIKAICDVCQGEFKNEAGLLIHKKRKHKEKQ